MDILALDSPHAVIDPSPYQVVEHTPLTEVHFLFTMLRLPRTFVTRFGALVGVISKKGLIAVMNERRARRDYESFRPNFDGSF